MSALGRLYLRGWMPSVAFTEQERRELDYLEDRGLVRTRKDYCLTQRGVWVVEEGRDGHTDTTTQRTRSGERS